MIFNVFKEDRFGCIGDIYYKYHFFNTNLPLIITFAPNMGFSSKSVEQGDDPWSFSFLKKRQINVISFSCISNKTNYYRDNKFIDNLQNLSNSLPEFPERLAYGCSMGAYGASAFSNVLKVNRLLLIDPISSRKRDIATWDYDAGRALNTFDYDWSGKYIDGAETNATGYVVYDPLFNLDKLHAIRYKNLVKLKVSGVGHHMTAHLQEMGMLAWLVETFISDNLDQKDFQRKAKNRRNIVRYYRWMLGPENKYRTHQRSLIVRKHLLAIRRKVTLQEEGFESYSGFRRAPNNKEIDLVIQTAKKIESIDIELSYKLMSLADKHRSSNTSIKNKLNEYEYMLGFREDY